MSAGSFRFLDGGSAAFVGVLAVALVSGLSLADERVALGMIV